MDDFLYLRVLTMNPCVKIDNPLIIKRSAAPRKYNEISVEISNSVRYAYVNYIKPKARFTMRGAHIDAGTSMYAHFSFCNAHTFLGSQCVLSNFECAYTSRCEIQMSDVR